MKVAPYNFTMGSLMYTMLRTRLDICFIVGMVRRYQSNIGVEHWTTFKHILKFLLGIRDYMLVYHCNESLPFRHTDSNFQFDRNSHKSTIDFVLWWGY